MSEPAPVLLSRRTEEVAFVERDDRVALLRLFALEQPPILLEGTSAVIWRLLDGTRDEGGLVAELAEWYDAPVEAVAADVASFLDQLVSLALLSGDRG